MFADLAEDLPVSANTYQTSTHASSVPSFLPIFFITELVLIAVSLVGMWKLFTKAGQPGWAAIIPVYNTYILLKIAGRPGWWLLLYFIPIVNIIVSIGIGADVAKHFGHSAEYGALLCGLLGIGYLILGFNSDRYTAGPTV